MKYIYLTFLILLSQLVSAQNLIPLSAKYSTVVTRSDDSVYKSGWIVWRDTDAIEFVHHDHPYGERWYKDKANDLHFEWLRHDKKFKIVYPSAELSALGLKSKWEAKASLINKNLIRHLMLVGKGEVLGYKSERYFGIVNGYTLQVEWLPEISLPAYIKEISKDKQEVIRISDLYVNEASPWVKNNSKDYEDMDFADIGDNESHPIARSHIVLGGFTSGHHH